ncbi:hypothetical protein GCM10007071_22460 [Marinobacter zhanjiangensis]|uniref:Uncharacterized protein n=1 Tax=Marinobacter zhanjiangensis TaxID=578215 RepID=A0ABQ3B1Q9_9GAMM|nr:hypothetical protein GCM10007071_22460 [Marinobacter zhanjiangensis]
MVSISTTGSLSAKKRDRFPAGGTDGAVMGSALKEKTAHPTGKVCLLHMPPTKNRCVKTASVPADRHRQTAMKWAGCSISPYTRQTLHPFVEEATG